MTLTVILLVVIVLLVAWLVVSYNGLVGGRNRAREAWSQIDVELKRRHDLIPNLVATVQGYAGHERGTLEAVTAARASAVSAGASGDPARIGQAENVLSQSLRSLFATTEAYPQLQAVSSFNQLQEELRATEDKIEFARRYYNGSVRDYNTALQRLPTSLLAGPMGFQAMNFFEVDSPADREVPQVNFGPAPAAPEPPPAAPPSQGPPSPPAPE